MSGKLHHHDCRESGGLCTQSALAQVDGDEAGADGLAHFVDAEVALGAYQDQCVVSGLKAAKLVEQIDARDLLIAVGYIAVRLL